MAISYVNVTFLRDWPFGPLVFPSGMTCSLPEEAGKGAVAAGFARLNNVGSESDRVAMDGATSNGLTTTVLSTDSAATAKSKIETVNAESGSTNDVLWSDGVGRQVSLGPGRILVPELTLSQAQTLRGVKGSTILAHDGSAITDQGGGVGGFVTVRDDYRSHSGIAGQGAIEDLDIDATIGGSVVGPAVIHGFYHPPRSGAANAHTIRNVGVYNAPNNGIHYDAGNDKLVAQRLRQEGAGGVGIYIGGSDCKGSDFGSVAVGSSCEINGAAVELDKFDFWRPNGANSDPTLKITGATNGCVVKSGTVEGKTLFIGKNENNSNKYINAKAQFAFVHFKLKDQVPDCLFEAQSADMVELISCKFGFSGNDIVTPVDYLIKITGATPGIVKIIGGGGLLRFVGRAGATNKILMDCGKHICDQPGRLLFEWGRMGTVEFVPVAATAGSSADGSLKTHLPFDGGATTYNLADYKFGWLNLQAYLGNTSAALDTAPATFTMPELPALSSYCAPGLRFIP
jgi:hypothetical protein